jgi:hypothetical protein
VERRQRQPQGLLGVLGASVAVALLLSACSSASPRTLATVSRAPASTSSDTTVGLPQAGSVLGTIRFSPRLTELYATRGTSLFVLVVPLGGARSLTVMRVGPDGGVVRKRVTMSVADYVMGMSTGPDGIYAGTAVISRFTQAPDELVRIDPTTLQVVARATFPASAAATEQGQEMWASIGDGRVLRLDPRTLEALASRRVVPKRLVTSTPAWVSKPAFGLGSVWVLMGDARDLELVRMDPKTLAVLSKTRLPTGGNLRQGLDRVVADRRHVYLTGSVVASVNRNGNLKHRPVALPELAVADIHGTGLVGITSAPSLVLLDETGRIIATTPVRDAGATIAVSGDDAWFLGDAGRGGGLVHVRLRNR